MSLDTAGVLLIELTGVFYRPPVRYIPFGFFHGIGDNHDKDPGRKGATIICLVLFCQLTTNLI
jgi:hypothetical protein